MALAIADTSHWQSWPDPDAAFAALDGVIVKRTQHVDYVDPAGLAVANLARARGKLVGHYHYVGPSPDLRRAPADPVAEADWFLTHSTDWRPGEPMFTDYEPRVPPADPDVWCATFTARIRQMRGPTAPLYAGESTANGLPWRRLVAMNVALWVARYYADTGVPAGPEPQAGPFGTWIGWQYTSRAIGRIPGITGNGLDLSRFDMTPAAWRRLGGLGGEDDMPTAKEIAQEVWWNSFVARRMPDGSVQQIPVIQEIADIKTTVLAGPVDPKDVADRLTTALTAAGLVTKEGAKQALSEVLREGAG